MAQFTLVVKTRWRYVEVLSIAESGPDCPELQLLSPGPYSIHLLNL